MEEAEALEVLSTINVWWDGDEVPQSIKQSDYKRRDFHYLKKEIQKDRQIIPIHGPRQVGKTTTVGQLIEFLIEEKDVDRENLVYINMENSRFMPEEDDVIEDSLEAYSTSVLEKAFNRLDEQIYIFIDEIQKSESWPSTLKYYTDTYSNIRFIITGSISTLIDESAKETLVGRLDPYLMLPIKFTEYLGHDEVMSEDQLLETFTDLRKSLKESLTEGDVNKYYSELVSKKGTLKRLQPEIRSRKDDYLLKGGYPAVLNLSYVDAYNGLDTDITSTVTGDIPSVFDVEKPKKMLKLLELAAYSSGQKINVQKMCRSTSLNNDTVKKYLNYLEEFFLIARSQKYSGTPYDESGKEKIYVPDTGLLNTLNSNLHQETLKNDDEMGNIMQTACFELSRRLQYYLSNRQDAEVHYWDKDGEVDLVLEGTNYLLPIEVKNGDSTNKNMSALHSFISDYNKAEFGIAVNNTNQLEKKGDIIHIPSWLYFMSC